MKNHMQKFDKILTISFSHLSFIVCSSTVDPGTKPISLCIWRRFCFIGMWGRLRTCLFHFIFSFIYLSSKRIFKQNLSISIRNGWMHLKDSIECSYLQWRGLLNRYKRKSKELYFYFIFRTKIKLWKRSYMFMLDAIISCDRISNNGRQFISVPMQPFSNSFAQCYLVCSGWGK